MRLPNLQHALSAITGFAVGGAVVILLVAAMIPRYPGVAIGSVRDRPVVTPKGIPNPEPRARLGLPGPTHTQPGTPRPASPRDRSSIDADSLAALIETLRDRDLESPVPEIEADDLRDDFDDPRPGGRTHEALDILAPRGTPVIAVEDGTIASLDTSQGGGGIVVYQFDPTGEFAYYYAHLEGHADHLAEGQAVERGQVLGFVGTSGNAPPNVPHLHFAIYKTPVAYRWWRGIPINPFSVFR